MPRIRNWAGAVLLVAATLLGLDAFWIEPARLVVHREELRLPQWPAPLSGLKVALISDLHVGSPYWPLEKLHDLVGRVNSERADVILLAGDYLINDVTFGTHVPALSIASELSQLRAPLGVIAVLGNHDWANDGPNVRAALEGAGIRVLDDEAIVLEFHGTSFCLLGLRDQYQRQRSAQAELNLARPGLPLLVLVHEPDIFAEFDQRPALTLAGHTHGGQVALPWIGRPIVPSNYGQRYAAGHIVEQGRHLFVTSGVGTSIVPVRFRVPPEIALLTLR